MGVLNSYDKNGKVFEIFEQISQIPRGSGEEKQISDFLVKFAKDRNLEYIQDEYNNVIIKKKASDGYENIAPVILQGHIDMVEEKNEGVDHDFKKDPLKLKVDGDIVSAEGTTLGGDNGIGVAYALSILDDDSLSHPAIEAVFTTEEETTMNGAEMLDASPLNAKYMINIDAEEEGVILMGSAGGASSMFTLPVKRKEDENFDKGLKIMIKGLKGGHSGMEIDQNRGNSNILMGRILDDLRNASSFLIIGINGGKSDNAITRETVSEIAIKGEDLEKIKSEIMNSKEIIKKELKNIDDDFTVEIEEISLSSVPMDKKSTNSIIDILLVSPDGVQKMSVDMKGLVETSSNIGAVETDDENVYVKLLVRSSVDSAVVYLLKKFKAVARLTGAEFWHENPFPGWRFDPSSKLSKVAIKTHRRLFNEEPRVEAIHAGLECGILQNKLPELDIISIGPNITGAHSPEEQFSISSVQKMYEFLIGILEDMRNL